MKKEKYLKIFRYLKEFANLRITPVRDIKTKKSHYPEILWFSEIIEDDLFENIIRQNFDSENDYWIHAKKPIEPEKPVFSKLPSELEKWVEPSSLKNMEDEPVLKETIEIDGETVSIDDRPKIIKRLEKYIDQQWLDDLIEYKNKEEIYKKKYSKYEKLNDIYKKLFTIYNKSQKFDEEFELVVGVGLLHFKESTDHPKICRHILTQQVDINFEYSDKGSKIIVRPSLESDLETETDFIIDLDNQFDKQNILDSEKEIERMWDKKNVYNLLGNDTIDDVLQMFVERISPEGKYSDSTEKPTTNIEKPKITFSPALLLRKRNTRSFSSMYERIIEIIENKNNDFDIPTIDDLIGASQDSQFDRSFGDSEDSSNHQPIYFPKEFNEEQIEIVEKSRVKDKVLVQGPPGTGKSHTIANIICHLLANGKKVLVTAYTKRALEVLKEQLPEEFRDLVVNLLSGDSSSMQDLQASVNSIKDQLSKIKLKDLKDEIKKSEKNLRSLRENKALTKNKLIQIKEKTSRTLNFNSNYSGTLIQIAEKLEKDSEKFEWYEDSYHNIGNEQVLVELNKFIERCRYYKEVDLSNFEYKLPDSNILPTVELVKAYRHHSDKILQHELDENQCTIGSSDFPTLNNLLDELNTHYNKVENIHLNFKENLLSTYLQSGVPHWKQKLKKSISILEQIDVKTLKYIDKNVEVTLPKEKSLKQLKNDARVLLDYLEDGKSLSGIVFAIKKYFLPKDLKERLYFIEEVKINGSECDTIEEFKHAKDTIALQQHLKEITQIWDVDVPSETYLTKYSYLKNITNGVKNITDIIDKSESIRKKIEDISNITITPFDVKRLKSIRNECQFILLLNKLEDYKDKISVASNYLNQDNLHPIRDRLLNAFEKKDHELYENLLSKLDDLHKQKNEFLEFQELKKKLTKTFPNLVESIESEDFTKDKIPELKEAFLYKDAQLKLNEYLDEKNEENLLVKLETLEKKIKISTETLASRKAWYHVVENLQQNRSLRQHLDAWVMAQKKIGKTGRGKKAKKFKKIAQQEMEYCKDSVPCWIMPLYKVAETVQPEQGMYDYVIIDEASQLGPDAIFLLFISKNIIIVGDDKQTSPEYVGVSHNTMSPHIKRHLNEIPFSEFYGTEFSFFDHARFFCDGVTTLREHFRCMPEIIEFSNRHFYEPDGKPLYPLRQYSEERLEPLRTKYCPKGFTKGRYSKIINEPEAEAIAETIAELVNNPKYDEKTFGVIVLQGSQQAKAIENIILKKIGEKEFHKRNIVCGKSASFQGDERDVILLSLVTAHNHRRRALTSKADERRFNVAVSRAKDQAFLFHSVQLEDLSNKDDLRYKLLDHFQNYSSKPTVLENPIDRSIGSQPDPFDSWFEVDVYNDIVRKGYSVIPQYEVAKGKYRIDLVTIFSNGTKIAIECDGDKWHGPEQYQNDISRQRVLERCGWEFFRIRGYEYYSDRKKALEPLWERFENEESNIASSTSRKEVINQEKEVKNLHKEKEKPKNEANNTKLTNANESIKEGESDTAKTKDIHETVIRYFNLDEKNNYYMANGAPTDSPTSIPIKKYQKEGFLLQCYESGHINKVNIATLVSKKIGRIYKNGSNPNDKLKSIKIIDSDKIVGIYFEENHQKKFKAHLTENIPSRDQLHLKGKKVMYNEFSDINYKIFSLEIYDEIKKLVFKSFNANGKPISNSYYNEEWKIIKKDNSNLNPYQESGSEEIKPEDNNSNSKDLFGNDTNGKQWETKLCYWSSVELPGYRYSKKKNAWWKRKERVSNTNSKNKKVTLNDIVKIKILESNKVIKVKLTKSNNSKEKKNGIQIINHKKPLAVSIKGKEAGDKTKIVNTDNYVKILEIN